MLSRAFRHHRQQSPWGSFWRWPPAGVIPLKTASEGDASHSKDRSTFLVLRGATARLEHRELPSNGSGAAIEALEDFRRSTVDHIDSFIARLSLSDDATDWSSLTDEEYLDVLRRFQALGGPFPSSDAFKKRRAEFMEGCLQRVRPILQILKETEGFDLRRAMEETRGRPLVLAKRSRREENTNGEGSTRDRRAETVNIKIGEDEEVALDTNIFISLFLEDSPFELSALAIKELRKKPVMFAVGYASFAEAAHVFWKGSLLPGIINPRTIKAYYLPTPVARFIGARIGKWKNGLLDLIGKGGRWRQRIREAVLLMHSCLEFKEHYISHEELLKNKELRARAIREVHEMMEGFAKVKYSEGMPLGPTYDGVGAEAWVISS